MAELQRILDENASTCRCCTCSPSSARPAARRTAPSGAQGARDAGRRCRGGSQAGCRRCAARWLACPAARSSPRCAPASSRSDRAARRAALARDQRAARRDSFLPSCPTSPGAGGAAQQRGAAPARRPLLPADRSAGGGDGRRRRSRAECWSARRRAAWGRSSSTAAARAPAAELAFVLGRSLEYLRSGHALISRLAFDDRQLLCELLEGLLRGADGSNDLVQEFRRGLAQDAASRSTRWWPFTRSTWTRAASKTRPPAGSPRSIAGEPARAARLRRDRRRAARAGAARRPGARHRARRARSPCSWSATAPALVRFFLSPDFLSLRRQITGADQGAA